MLVPNDEAFRAMLDASGVLREGALEPPSRGEAYTVFAQRTDACLEAASWERHAAQFFDARVGLTVEKRYGENGPPAKDAARVVVAASDAPPATRLCFGRPREDADFDAAEAADIRAGSPGLGLLARRCRYVWLVAVEEETDRAALLLAAIVASVVLGPILLPDQAELIGVRTARSKLEKLGAAYR